MKRPFFGYALLSLLLLAVLSVNTGYTADRTLPKPSGRIVAENNKDWGFLTYEKSYVLLNNTWNSKATRDPYQQSVFTEKLNGSSAFGWRWNWPFIYSSVLSYPEIIYGDKPFADPWKDPASQVHKTPIPAGAKKITADFDIALKATGNYNMAFEIWVISKLPVVNTNITHEIMIWNVKHGFPPAGSRQGSLVVDGVRYDLYVKGGHGDASGNFSNSWTYIAFVAQKDVLKGPLHLSRFIDYLIEKKYFTKNHYLTSVELGNEVQGGKGCVEIKDFNIKIE
jgi:hypothetical protein